jgi:hypothetical protein
MDENLSRTQIYLRANQVRFLSKTAKERKSTQSALIREAIDAHYLDDSAQSRKTRLLALAGTFGKDAFSGLALRALRSEERVS